VGLSLLTALKLDEFIATGPQEYVACATMLANDREKLAHLRTTLRERMLVSSLCDAPAFAQKVESACREMWREWCAKTVRASQP
jgi:predicted O-linked N-acetylglucosamine transferase (SPINDLY family)